MKRILFYWLLSFLSVFSFAQKEQDSTSLLFNKAYQFHYTNKDSAYFYYKKIIDYADKKNDLQTLFSAYTYLINANGYHYDIENHKKTLDLEGKVLKNDKRLDTFKYLQVYKDYFLFDKGNFNYQIKQYKLAKKYFKQLYTKLDSIPTSKMDKHTLTMYESLHAYLAIIYKHTSKFELAEQTLLKELNLIENNKDSISNWENVINNERKLLSKVYVETSQFKKADSLLVIPLEFYLTKIDNPRYKNNIAAIFLSSAESKINQKKFKETIRILNKGNQVLKKNNPFNREYNLLYGDSYLGLNQFDKALQFYIKSLELAKNQLKFKTYKDIATIYTKIGNLYTKKGDFLKALDYYQLALIELSNNFNDKNIELNPSPKEVVFKTDLISVLKQKLIVLKSIYQKTHNQKYLNTALNTAKNLITTLDALRPEFESKMDKQFLIAQTYPAFKLMVENAFELYKLTHKSTYIDDAFFFMEKSKSILLLEVQNNTQAISYGSIPQKIIEKEQAYKAKITFLEKKLFEQKQEDKKVLKEDLFKLKTTYYDFLKDIEKRYPKYYQLKYNSDVVTIDEIQNKLNKHKTLLNFFVGNNKLYIIGIEKSKKHFIALDFNATKQEKIKKLYKEFSNINIQDDSVYKDSYEVYLFTLKPILDQINTKELIVINDDILNYLPFSALNTSESKNSFLIKTHNISYDSSATLYYAHLNKVTNKDSKLLVFAPEFKGQANEVNHERTNLAPLIHNQQEAKYVAQFFKGKVFLKEKATIYNFNNEYKDYNLLHFATHASVNDKHSDYSFLAFSDTGDNSNLLYVKDLYNYNLRADLVTLSACETGVGKLEKGEGMISLARAFNYAGVPAIVTTLWKIDDENTSEIMEYFYENLNNGLSKNEALRQAKLSYLEWNEDEILQHPYYWAGIVLTGNTAQVSTTNYLLWIVVFGLLTILIVVIYKKIRKSNSV